MMKDLIQGCPDDGELRALLDDPDSHIRMHVENCEKCAERLSELEQNAQITSQFLQELPGEDMTESDLQPHWLRLQQRRRAHIQEVRTESSVMSTIWGRRSGRLAAGIAAVLAVVMVFSISPMASVAEDFLDSFRVQKFAAITVEQDAFDEFAGGMLMRMATSDAESIQSSMMDLGEFETTFDIDEEDPFANIQEFDSVDEARDAYGDLRVPEGSLDGYSDTPSIYLSEAGSATADVNTAEAQSIIDELNLPIYSLPDASQYPTMTFQMDIPQAVVLDYEGSDPDSHVVVAQMASPVLHTPEGLDMNALREDILAVPSLPPDFVGQLRAIEDWQNTLIVPVPEGASSSDVTVDGQPGLLITMDDDSGAVVLWEDDGQLYVVAGTESGDTIRDFASSLD